MTSPQPGRPLHELLGLSADTSVSKLRFEYERAMAEATRGGNIQRALALSRAFDALSATTRRQVYAPVLEPSSTTGPPGPPRTGRGADGGPGHPAGRRISPRRRSAGRRTVVLLIGIPAAVLAVVAYHQYYQQEPAARFRPAQVPVTHPSPYRVTVAPVAVPPARTINPAAGATRRSRLVPLDTPVDANGLVTILCAPHGTRPGYSQYVHPGVIVACANGAVPHIVG